MSKNNLSENLKNYSNLEIAALADKFQKSPQTVKLWIRNDDPRLTSTPAKEALKAVKKLSKNLKSSEK